MFMMLTCGIYLNIVICVTSPSILPPSFKTAKDFILLGMGGRVTGNSWHRDKHLYFCSLGL